MHILPKPKKVQLKEGIFTIQPYTKIRVTTSKENRFAGQTLKEAIKSILGIDVRLDGYSTGQQIKLIISQGIKCEEGYELCVKPKEISIKGNTYTGIYYGVQTLIQLIKQYKRHIPVMTITDTPDFPERGFYYDVTRGKVPTLNTLKGIADLAASYKINQLQLYVEHTFAYVDQSEVWSCTDPLTADEIIAFDEYCRERHIELVPSIATFGHLYEALRSNSFASLCELEDSRESAYNWIHRMQHHTLDIKNDKSIDFVKSMIEQFIPLFQSNKFNICADETFDLGKGKNKAYCEQVGTSKMYVEFLNKIINIVKGYNKEVMFWGDIIIKHPEYIEELPKDLVCLNWWYWREYDEEKVKIIADNGFVQYLCPGTSGWNNIMNNHQVAYDNIRLMTGYGSKYKARGILNTDWGDYGHINLQANSMPGFIYGANFSWNVEEYAMKDINKAIDLLEYQQEEDGLIGLLHEVSALHYMNFHPIVYWLHHDSTKELANIDVAFEDIQASIPELETIEEALMDYLWKVPVCKRHDIEEFILATRGVKLFNLLLPVLKTNVVEQKMKALKSPDELAVELEYWLNDYKAAWRERNKESELYRIVDCIRMLCGYLRQWRD